MSCSVFRVGCAVLVVAFFIAGLGVGRALSADEPGEAFLLAVEEDAQRIDLASGGARFNIEVRKNRTRFISMQDSEGQCPAILNTDTKASYEIGRMSTVRVVMDEPEVKCVQACYTLRDVKSKEPIDAELDLTLQVRKGLPCLFVSAILRNRTVPAFRARYFWGWFHGGRYAQPDGTLTDWQKTYRNLEPVNWLFLTPYAKASQKIGRGLIAPGCRLRETPFSSVLVCSDPMDRALRPGGEWNLTWALFPAESAEAGQALYERIAPHLPKRESTTDDAEKRVVPGPDTWHYRPRRTIIGYPPIPVTADHPADLKNQDDARHRIRMTNVKFGDIDAEWADQRARQLAQQGFTHILTERNRYLFYEKGDKMPLPSKSHPKTLDELIATSRLLVDACHKQGIRVIHHLTCTMVGESFAERHPEFASVDMRKGDVPVQTGYDTLAMCVANRDFQDLYMARLERLMKETGADGLMVDEVAFWEHTACGCKACRRRFQEDTGHAMPEKVSGAFFGNVENPAYRAYLDWRRKQIVDFDKRIQACCRKYGGLVYSYSSVQTFIRYPLLRSGRLFEDLLETVDVLGIECEPAGFRECSTLCVWPMGVYDMKVCHSSADHLDASPWAVYYPKDRADYTWEWLMCFSQGFRSWWRSESQRADESSQPLRNWERNVEDLLVHATPNGSVAIPMCLDAVFANPEGNRLQWVYGLVGTCGALTDSQTPYRVILRRDVVPAKLAEMGINTLMLMNAASLSDEMAENIRAFVKGGGTLIASGNVGLFNDRSERRADFALADVLGLSMISEAPPSANQLVISDANPVTGDLTGTFRHDEAFNRVNVTEGWVLGHMVDGQGRRYPGLVFNEFGKGRAVYFAGRPELKYFFTHQTRNRVKAGSFWRDGRDDAFREILSRAAALGGAPSVKVDNVPSGVFVEGFRHAYGPLRGVQVRLINFMGGRLKEGVVPYVSDYRFPDVSAARPDPGRPMTVSVRAVPVNAVVLFSPDFEKPVALRFTSDGTYTKVKLPALYRCAMLYFSQGAAAALPGGPPLAQLPEPRKLVIEERPSLAGAYRAEDAVVFADAPEMAGGYFSSNSSGEPCRIIYGGKGKYPRLTIRMTLKELPANPVLDVGGMDDNAPAPEKAPFRMTINGHEVFNGDAPFPDSAWSVHSWPVKRDWLKQGENTLVIESTSPSAKNFWPPWLAIHFARIRSGEQAMRR